MRFAEQELNRKRVFPTRRALAIICVALLWYFIGGTQSVLAEDPIRLISSQASAEFSERLTFSLEAEANATITSIALRFRRGESPLTTRARPDFQPGRRVVAGYVKELEQGEIAPGTEIMYTWRIVDELGNRLDTLPQTVLYSDDRFAWRTLREGPISLHWYSDGTASDARNREDRAEALVGVAQTALLRLRNDMGVAPQEDDGEMSRLLQTVEIYVYNSSNDMRRAVSPRSDEYDSQIVTLGMAVSEDTLIVLGSHRDVEGTLAHELSHLVVGAATNNPYAGLPRWLDEGLAMFTEATLPDGNARALDRAIRSDNLISVRSLSGYTGDPAQVDLYYGEVYSVVDFLLTQFGEDKMAELLRVFSAGVHQEDALQRVYGLGLDELDAQWRASLGLQARPTPAPTLDSGEREPEEEDQSPGSGSGSCFPNLLPSLLVVGIPFVWRSASPRNR